MGREPARVKDEGSADDGRLELNPGCREPLAQRRPRVGRRAQEGTGDAGGARSHQDRCFKSCFLMIPAMLQPRPAWNAGGRAAVASSVVEKWRPLTSAAAMALCRLCRSARSSATFPPTDPRDAAASRREEPLPRALRLLTLLTG